jgi:hypothetical protein
MDSKHYETLSGGIFLIGLGIIFLVPGFGFWPWILVVAGAAGLPAALAAKKGWLGWQGFFWMVGLAVLFASGFFWPGILILAGISTLIGALTRENEGSPFASAARDQHPDQATFDVSASSSEPQGQAGSDTRRLKE